MKKNPGDKKISKYLPSKKFVIVMGGGLVLIGGAFAAFFLLSGKINFVSNKASGGLSAGNETVADLMQRSTAGDGIPDWEKVLWGLDPSKTTAPDGTSDADYIANKRKQMNAEEGSAENAQNMTETEKFAQEFFTSFAALKADGQIDQNTINNFSGALGQKVVNPTLPDAYAEKDAKIASVDDSTSQKNYYLAVKALFDKHKQDGLGSELGIVSEGLAAAGATDSGSADLSGTSAATVTSTPANYSELLVIGQSYQSFAKEVMQTSVPKSLLSYHLRIANSANNTGLAVLNMAKMVDDPVVGLSGLSQYQQYSAELITAVTDLEGALSKQQ